MRVPPSQWADLDGDVHYVDFGGPADGPLLICVHGLGGSHVNWLALAPLLTPTCRVIALDLPGFGHTRGLGRETSVTADAELLHRFIRQVTGGPAILIGNSMGGLVSALATSAHPESVAGLVLIDPAVPPAFTRPDPLTTAMFAAYFAPGVGRAVIRGRQRMRTAEQLAMETLRLCCADPSRVSAEVLAAHVALTRSRSHYAELEQEFLVATRSMLWTLTRRRQFSVLMRRITAPVLLLHGDKDRLVAIGSARAAARANPSWRFEVAPGVGHVPQLEVPQWTADRLFDWMRREAAAAAIATRSAHVGVDDRGGGQPGEQRQPGDRQPLPGAGA